MILSPVFISIICILSVTGEREVFYLQTRIGFQNKKFRIFKFATMLKNSMNMGSGSITLRDDPRVTKFGSILRKSKLNELPQLLNILIGDISFIGPRPLDEKNFNLYPNHIKKTIYNVKPGLSGIGSIFFRDEERMISESNLNPQDFYEKYISPKKGNYEMYYQKNISFFLDLKLILITILVVLFPKTKLHYKLLKIKK